MENFIVSARKYRPAVFRSVVGQEHITSTLKNAIARGQLAHAYLFCGPRGVGKTTCARIFAKAINCLSPKEMEACGECESCRAFEQDRSMNIHELDAASNNSVEDIRTLTDQVRIPPQIGKYSVYIIDEVHMLSAAAFNAFLKTLEEPPAHALFILATTEKHKIIPTILSRCQIYDFNRIRVEDGVSYLKYVAQSEGVSYDDESLNLIAQKADGGMRDALSMFDKAVSFCGSSLQLPQVARTLNVLDYDVYFGLVEMMRAGDYPGALRSLDEALRQGFSGQSFLQGLGGHLRDLLMCKDAKTQPLLEVTGSLLERYRDQAARCDTAWLFGAIATMTDVDGELRTSLNQRLNIELGLMKLAGLAAPQKTGDRKQEAGLPEVPTASNEAEKKRSEPSLPAPSPAVTEITPGAQPTQPAPQPQAAQAVAPQPSAAPEPLMEASAPDPQEAAPQMPDVAGPAKPLPPSPTPLPAPAPTASPISGQSIADLMNAPMAPIAAAAQAETTPETSDPEAEEKIKKFFGKFLAALQAERPRFAQAFMQMQIEGNRLRIAAASQELHDEIVRARGELTAMLAAIAGVSGAIELEVDIVENDAPARPIKVEDRLNYLTEQNPLLTNFRKELDFEIE